jgi:hypothetical protein
MTSNYIKLHQITSNYIKLHQMTEKIFLKVSFLFLFCKQTFFRRILGIGVRNMPKAGKRGIRGKGVSLNKLKISKNGPKGKRNSLVVVANGLGSHFTSPSQSPSNSKVVALNLLSGNPQRIGNYEQKHKILIVGDGDFSFSLSLATSLGRSKYLQQFMNLQKKYKSAESNADYLRMMKATVRYNVDATKLKDNEWLQSLGIKFNRIIFNFPHTGTEGTLENTIQINQQLLLDFFVNAVPYLAKDGEVHVTLRSTSFYDKWDIAGQAKKAGLKLHK